MAIKTAIIGLGIMGRRMLEHMGLHDQFAPDFIWDPDADACQLAQDIAPNAVVTGTAEDAIAGADLVYLACPPIPRKAYALMAAAAGKAVFLEKPLGVDVAESRDLVLRLAGYGVPTAVNFVQAAGDPLRNIKNATESGKMGRLMGADIVVTYANWPRQWQVGADWLRMRREGGMTREVISHFLFFAERALGPLTLVWAQPNYPEDAKLCETHVAARLETADGSPVTIMASVGGAQPDRQELTIKGSLCSHRISEFVHEATSDGGAYVPVSAEMSDPRATSLKAQLDEFSLLMAGKPSRLATQEEALRVQILIEGILQGKA